MKLKRPLKKMNRGWLKVGETHFNEPRDAGYSKKHKQCYKDWTDKDKPSIFSGCSQGDVFFFCMAIGVNRNKKKVTKNKAKDIPVSVFSEAQKWGILSSAISRERDPVGITSTVR